jgi:hypothetical protein
MDNRKIATTAMMVLSVLVLFIGTLGSIGGAASGNLFEQPPPGPHDPWGMTRSTYDPSAPIDLLVYDNFWGVTGDICDLHWYGFSGIWNATYRRYDSCDPDGMIFDITFYANNATGMPGEVVCSYENVSPKISYYGDYLEPPDDWVNRGYYFEADLSSCCQLRDGWVSIQSQGSDNGCWFSWMSTYVGDNSSLQEDRILNITNQLPIDQAFILTGKAEVPAFTPIGLIALISALSAIAALTITQKRKRH